MRSWYRFIDEVVQADGPQDVDHTTGNLILGAHGVAPTSSRLGAMAWVEHKMEMTGFAVKVAFQLDPQK